MTYKIVTDREMALERENTNLIQALRIQAVTVESLQEQIAAWVKENSPGGWIDELREELAAIKNQKPIGYVAKDGFTILYCGDVLPFETELFAAPVQPAPLTDEQIDAAYRKHGICRLEGFTAAVRELEAAIKGGAT